MNEHIPQIDRHPYVKVKGKGVRLLNTHPDDPCNNQVFRPKQAGMVDRNLYDLSDYVFTGWCSRIEDLPEVTHKDYLA